MDSVWAYPAGSETLLGVPDRSYTMVYVYHHLLSFDESLIPDLENGYVLRFYYGPLITPSGHTYQGGVKGEYAIWMLLVFPIQ